MNPPPRFVPGGVDDVGDTVELDDRSDLALLALGTDGTDGPTDIAGSLVDPETRVLPGTVDSARSTPDRHAPRRRWGRWTTLDSDASRT